MVTRYQSGDKDEEDEGCAFNLVIADASLAMFILHFSSAWRPLLFRVDPQEIPVRAGPTYFSRDFLPTLESDLRAFGGLRMLHGVRFTLGSLLPPIMPATASRFTVMQASQAQATDRGMCD